MLGRSPETEALRLLYAGAIGEGVGAWQPFLAALADMTRARGVLLRIEAAGAAHDALTGTPGPLPAADLLRRLRRERVYAQDEVGADTPLRLIRLAPRPEAQALLLLSHPHRDFRAVDAALLDRMAVHVAQAVETWLSLARERARMRAAAGQATALGAGWLWLDATGRVVEADPGARAALGPTLAPGGRFDFADPVLARTFRGALDRAVTGRSGAQILTLQRSPLLQLLLHPGLSTPAPGVEPVIAAALRRAPEAAALPPEPLAAALDLNRSETRLAVLLCDGRTLAEAAEALGWTLETTRSASKRIFARTGTRGQGDLIRRMQGGVEWLATG